MRKAIAAVLGYFMLIGTAQAFTITAVGNVDALTNENQVLGVVGNGNFDEGPTSGSVPLNVYTSSGLTWHAGALTTILPGSTTPGSASQPMYWSFSSSAFPTPAGGGNASGVQSINAGVATFSSNVTITEVGLTACNNGSQYLTVWDKAGNMLGQVNWVPSGDSSFVGISSRLVPIGMVAYGNHDVWGGDAFSTGGASTISDSWVWASGRCTTNAQCDDGNVCTTDTCSVAGVCTHANNTASCDDGNLCTTGDICSSGSCQAGTPVTCNASDQCHAAGTCDPTSGACSNPTASDGTGCNDGNACTQSDTCLAGICTGSSPVSCTALDGCHEAGTCDPTTGACSNPNKTDGSACSDSNACTTVDTCESGVCTGTSPVACPPIDQCHQQGSCDPISGLCSSVAKANGSACDDGNACTTNDTCQAGVCTGASPVTCAASDSCHAAGVCDPTSGICTNPSADDGTACNDGNACTQSDACKSGVCTGSNPVACAASDACHVAGTCDPMSGACSNPAAADGTTCDDNNACTTSDTCLAGACTGGTAVDCKPLDACHEAGTCDPTSGACSTPPKADGASCSDNLSCTNGDACKTGVCEPGVGVSCKATDDCHEAGSCDEATGTCMGTTKADGTKCMGGTCQDGDCVKDNGAGGGGSGGGDEGGSGGATSSSSSGAGAGGSTKASGGGCGCRIADDDNGSPTGALVALALGLMVAKRRRRI